MSLLMVKEKQKLKIVDINTPHSAIVEHLANLGLKLGTEVIVLRRSTYNMMLLVSGITVALSNELADKVICR